MDAPSVNLLSYLERLGSWYKRGNSVLLSNVWESIYRRTHF